MPDAFHTHIRKALADPNLQAALDANAERRINARMQAYASLPEPLEVMRRRAHAVRAHTIAHHEEYLARFAENVQANGIHIHQAKDASQAVQILLNIAQQSGARLVAKSKSMVSEEIELNNALEAEGLRVVETDLGEYIIQLRGERPAHIITPAVHLRRGDVGQTFHEKLGVPFTDDIPTMTETARRTLRQVFLDADLGVSGVNFGVVESGTLCVVTNEGNGRMVTTLPRIHVALMGIERLVPSLEDLALMLYLLPRSATGQKLSAYTSLINAPRQANDADGPQERHLILVDNGRRAMRASTLSEALLCIRCGACLNACPVFREIGGHAYVGIHGEGSTYPGPIGSVVSPGLFGQAEFGQLARASSLCGACKEACPVDIDLPKLLLRIRAGYAPTESNSQSNLPAPNAPGYLSLGLRLYTWMATNPRIFHIIQGLAGALGRMLPAWVRLPSFTGWGFSKDFPRPAPHPFWEAFANRHPNAQPNGDHGPAIHDHPAKEKDDRSLLPPSAPSLISSTLIDRYAIELAALGGAFHRSEASKLAEDILALLRDKRIDAIQAWEADQFPAGLLAELNSAGIRVIHEANPAIKAGLTASLAAIAESGSLVLPSGPGRPMTASLLPEIHIAVLRARDIRENLPQALNLREVRDSSVTVLISGPSRTGDIEMTLTIGVHGPGELHVFCIS